MKIMEAWLRPQGTQRALICLLILVVNHLLVCLPINAQTKPVPPQQSLSLPGEGQVPSPSAQYQTQNTVPNPYQDAMGTIEKVKRAADINQTTVNSRVNDILVGYYSPLVFQAAEQNQGPEIQRAANNILNANLGAVNDTYRGLHQWFKDDLVGNLFSNIGQLTGKWLSEYINGWVADAAQFLSKFLRIFVLNPNVAVNGLNGQPDDGISRWIRQLADIMYGIAVDLLLLLFILCIWKFWAKASWEGAGNLMGPLGRLIFTAGLLLAWPTIYAFIIQISNEMINAIGFNTADKVLMLDYAMAQVVKGGLIAAGAGATNVFAPIFGNIALPEGSFVGELFHFASILIYTILGSAIVGQLVSILVLKAIQTALLLALYVFAPIFLVFFATPDTESYATTYVKALVETSLWTFVWVGLLHILVIVLFSDFNPWGKTLVTIGVLQMMIKVPSFIGYAQISPVSEYVSGGKVYDSFVGALDAIKGMPTGMGTAAANGLSWITGDKGSALNNAKSTASSPLGTAGNGASIQNTLDKAGRDRIKEDPHAMESLLLAGPQSKTLELGQGRTQQSNSLTHSPVNASARFAHALNQKSDPLRGRMSDLRSSVENGTGQQQLRPPSKLSNHAVSQFAALNKNANLHQAGQIDSMKSAFSSDSINTGLAHTETAGLEHTETAAEIWELPVGQNDPRWQQQALGEEQKGNLAHECAGGILRQIGVPGGLRMQFGSPKCSISGNAKQGVQRISMPANPSDSELAFAVYSAAFANELAHDVGAHSAARNAVMRKRVEQPNSSRAIDLQEPNDNWNKPQTFEFQKEMFHEAVEGSQAYMFGQTGNDYTNYLTSRFGGWSNEKGAEAVKQICNSKFNESTLSLAVNPGCSDLIGSGIHMDEVSSYAMKNVAVQNMHPARRNRAVQAILQYTLPQARAVYDAADPKDFVSSHGELARLLPANDVDDILAMHDISAEADLASASAPQYLELCRSVAARTHSDFATAYTRMLSTAAETAQHLNYLKAEHNLSQIRSFSDLSAVAVKGSTIHLQHILDAASKQVISMHSSNNSFAAPPLQNQFIRG